MFLDVVPLNVSFRRALVGIKLVEWNNFVARVANLNIQVGQDRFFLIKNSGELTVNSMYKYLVDTGIIKSWRIFGVKIYH